MKKKKKESNNFSDFRTEKNTFIKLIQDTKNCVKQSTF